METTTDNIYKTLLEEAGKFHGDVCAGIEIGTRMTMTGLSRIGISDPKGVDKKKLIIFVEIDRCATDAIMALTGCRPGKRTMKVLDYGKMAATFINIESNKAVRVVIKKGPGSPDEKQDFGAIPEDDLFTITDVTVQLKPEDMPGKPLRRCKCDMCGETVMDGRDVSEDGKTLCRPCSTGIRYFSTDLI